MNALLQFITRPLRRRREWKFRVAALETVVEHLLKRSPETDWEAVGFNGQQFRQRIFRDLLQTVGFEVLLETGTWLGKTTGYLATTAQAPVYSCELHPLFHAAAKASLTGLPNVHLTLGDSRDFLATLSATEIRHLSALVYLDAHWHQDLPLQEEMEIIAGNWQRFVIMIDDFQVPGDDGYGYDRYGKSKTLSLRCFAPVFDHWDLVPFFPSAPSCEETGGKRGCVVLAKRGELSEKLRTLPSLRVA